jgi:hypothetical protein
MQKGAADDFENRRIHRQINSLCDEKRTSDVECATIVLHGSIEGENRKVGTSYKDRANPELLY